MAAPAAFLDRLGPQEKDCYVRLFRAAGGDLQGHLPLPSAAAAHLLRRSRLPQDALRRIWELAAPGGGGGLDLAGFCAACRLVAHAQQRPGAPLDEGALSAAPGGPPWFEEEDGRGSLPAGRAAEASATSAVSDFDFEAAAFGVDGSLSHASPTGPPQAPLSPWPSPEATDASAAFSPPASWVRSLAGELGRGSPGRDSPSKDPPGPLSVAELARVLGREADAEGAQAITYIYIYIYIYIS